MVGDSCVERTVSVEGRLWTVDGCVGDTFRWGILSLGTVVDGSWFLVTNYTPNSPLFWG